MKRILFYHKGCPDGFGSAYCFWRKFKDKMTYEAVSHGQTIEPALYVDKEVYMADICLDKEQMLKIRSLAKKFCVLDHHITAKDKFDGYDFFKFNLDKSGAMMCWDYLFPKKEPPLIIKYIQDRDLYSWQYEDSRSALSVLDSQGFDFHRWQSFEKKLSRQRSRSVILEQGESIYKSKQMMVDIIAKKSFHLCIAGVIVPAVNTPILQSEVLAELAKDSDTFSAGYYFDGEKFVFSLRSSPFGMDVSKVATTFGGGGHKHAAGFSVLSLSELGAYFGS